MKVFLVDSLGTSVWIDGGHRLRAIGDLCRHRFDISEVFSARRDVEEPILAACGREADATPLINSAALVDIVKREPPDLCIAPFRDGLAHGLLMARACGELPQSMRVVLAAEEPTRSMVVGRGDIGDCILRPLVADAMERFCLEQADALLVGPDANLGSLQSLGIERLPPLIRCAEAPLDRDAVLRPSTDPKEICFIGPFVRSANVVSFIDVVESLASKYPNKFECVVFLGPISNPTHAPGKEWLGRRALNWPFAFRTIETNRFADVVSYLRSAKCVAYVPALPRAFREELRVCGLQQIWLDADVAFDPDQLRSALGHALERKSAAFSLAAKTTADTVSEALQSVKVRRLPSANSPSQRQTTLSICILHKDRPLLLRQALDSVFAQITPAEEERVQLILFDNGSTRSDSIALLDELDADQRIGLFRQSPALPHSTAMNAMASHATSDFMTFLDDDNLIAGGGIAALLRACSSGVFDVITSNLWLFDADRSARKAAKLVFVGPARSSGLFFNFFGDTCMAVRRETFERIGGFYDAKAPSPAPDWVFLARAQAAGAAIGVLQEPAFLYRRDFNNADLNWQKHDQHGLRRLVLAQYSQKYDADLVAKLAQHLVVSFYR